MKFSEFPFDIWFINRSPFWGQTNPIKLTLPCGVQVSISGCIPLGAQTFVKSASKQIPASSEKIISSLSLRFWVSNWIFF